MGAANLAEWLAHAERQHAVGIDLGLERVTRVAEALGFEPPDHRPAPRSLIVAGTNGKGSTTVFSEALLRAAGLRVGATLSPHVHAFNERVRVDGRPVDDAWLCRAFSAVEAARGTVSLTYFEYSALVALWIFRDAAVDVAVLEVGLGGRLDAFNLVGADVAVVTSIGLDHQEFLGDDREVIGREKAGVMRPGRPVVIGADVSESVRAEAARLACPMLAMGRSFEYAERRDGWSFRSQDGSFQDLPRGDLAPYNCAVAIAAVGCLTAVTEPMVREALATASLPGRCEAWDVAGRLLVVDVAHNPAGAAFLRSQLETRYPGRRFVGLLGMLADKDAAGVVAALDPLVAEWICVPTPGPRGQSGEALAARVREGLQAREVEVGARVNTPAPVWAAATVEAGLAAAIAARVDDGILSFGSFALVEQLRAALTGGTLAAGPRGSVARAAAVAGPAAGG
jgi:dihydrofolate synthase/folylpolyglutamate synthase